MMHIIAVILHKKYWKIFFVRDSFSLKLFSSAIMAGGLNACVSNVFMHISWEITWRIDIGQI